jgi:hypothetical protein
MPNTCRCLSTEDTPDYPSSGADYVPFRHIRDIFRLRHIPYIVLLEASLVFAANILTFPHSTQSWRMPDETLSREIRPW